MQTVAAGSPRADRPLRVDHPVPWYRGGRRKRMEGVPRLPRMAFQSRERGDLPVRRDAPAGDSPHDGIYTLIRCQLTHRMMYPSPRRKRAPGILTSGT